MVVKATPPQTISDPDAGSRVLGYAPFKPISVDGFTPTPHVRRVSIIGFFLISFAPAVEAFRLLFKRVRLHEAVDTLASCLRAPSALFQCGRRLQNQDRNGSNSGSRIRQDSDAGELR